MKGRAVHNLQKMFQIGKPTGAELTRAEGGVREEDGATDAVWQERQG